MYASSSLMCMASSLSSTATASANTSKEVQADEQTFKCLVFGPSSLGESTVQRLSAKAEGVICVYLLAPYLHLPYLLQPGGLEILCSSLQRLRSYLRSVGNDLVIAKDLRSLSLPSETVIITETEPSRDDWISFIKSEADSLKLESKSIDDSALDPPLINFKEWKLNQTNRLISEPSTINKTLARIPASDHADIGDIPSPSELRSALLSHYSTSSSLLPQLKDAYEAVSSSDEARLVSPLFSSFSPESILDAYLLSQGDPKIVASVKEAIDRLESPAAKGASFKSIIGPLVEIGTLSPQIVKSRAEMSAGPLRDYALRYLETRQFHRDLAQGGFHTNRPDLKGAQTKRMTWRGLSTEYCVAEPSQPLPGAPALVLVHGFGAFSHQWRDNVTALASAGYTVYAPTLIGFGRSEKGAIRYSQDSWRDFLRDFILTEVKKPVILAGNSIGGFISTSCAADYPSLVKGLILLNSAGPVDAAFDFEKWKLSVAAKKPPPRILIEIISRGLFWYLEQGIARTLKWLYCTNPARADDWLEREIARAAGDPGSLEVFQSAFYLPPPRPLNFLINELYRGPTLVLQGVLDPLNDAKKRSEDIKAASPSAEVVMLQAGHCPHDEVPEMVNKGILDFASNIKY